MWQRTNTMKATRTTGTWEHGVLTHEEYLSFCCYVQKNRFKMSSKPVSQNLVSTQNIYSCKNKNKIKHLKSIIPPPNNNIIIYSFKSSYHKETNSPEVHRGMSWTLKLPPPRDWVQETEMINQSWPGCGM